MANWNDLFGGGGLTFPRVGTSSVSIKDGQNVVFDNLTSGFTDALNNPRENQEYESGSFNVAANTSEQVILSVSGSGGVLTHLLCPALASAGTVTVRITTDGKVETFTSKPYTVANRLFCLGLFLNWNGQTAATSAVGDGSRHDYGYSDSPSLLMTTPLQAIESGIGFKWKDSIVISVQGSVAFSATAELDRAGFAYLDHLPKGL